MSQIRQTGVDTSKFVPGSARRKSKHLLHKSSEITSSPRHLQSRKRLKSIWRKVLRTQEPLRISLVFMDLLLKITNKIEHQNITMLIALNQQKNSSSKHVISQNPSTTSVAVAVITIALFQVTGVHIPPMHMYNMCNDILCSVGLGGETVQSSVLFDVASQALPLPLHILPCSW